MKKYKTSEAIAMLEQNPKLEIKNCMNGEIYRLDGYGDLINKKQGYYYTVNPKHEWELIQQPVDFLTALKAYSEGKTIRSEFAGCKWLYVPRKDGNGWITDENGNPVGREEILQGTWHIEEGEPNE